MRSTAVRLGLGLSVVFLALSLGSCHKKSPSEPSCTFTLSASTFSIPAAGGSGAVEVSGANGCAWTAETGTSWLAITSGSSGSGPGTVRFTAATNGTTAARTGTLTVAGKTVTVTQEAAPAPCSYTVSPESAAVGSDGGTGTLAVATTATCSWTAASAVEWIRIASGAQGSGNGTVTYEVDPNSGSDGRDGTITVAGRTVTIVQVGASATCVSAVSPTSDSFGSDAGSGSVAVTAPGSCSWRATSGASWLTITDGAGGTGSGTVRYSVAANPDTAGRETTLDIGGVAVTVAQSGNASACEYSVAQVSFAPCMNSPTALTAIVTTGDMCPWTASSDVPWLTVTSGAAGTGSGHIRFNVADNYDAPRSGQVLVRWPTPTAGQNLQVAQAGCRYGVTKSAIGFAAAGGADNFDVLQQSDPIECGGPLQDGCVWTATADVSWITITSSQPVKGDGRVSFSVAPNPHGEARSGIITVRDKTVRITQSGTPGAGSH